MKLRWNRGLGWLLAGMLSWVPFCLAQTPTADDIVAKAYANSGGDDGISHLAFSFTKPDGSLIRLEFDMVWKNYKEARLEEPVAKTMFFSTYPPSEVGKSYMAWFYKDKSDDEWNYLPELRMVRKVTHGDHSRHHHDDDDFAHSLLTHGDLAPRDPRLDTHKLLKEMDANGKHYYVVECTPKQSSENYPYQKAVQFINADGFLADQIDYYNLAGELRKQQFTKWDKVGGVWVWKQVTANQPNSAQRTVLDITRIRVNLGLKDEIFSARSLQQGVDSLAP